MSSIDREPMLELYLFETNQLLQELEQVLLESEKSNSLEGSINEIFRIMHTIKGSSAMMLFNSIAELAHKVEDLFAILREQKPQGINHAMMIDLVLEVIDFFKTELAKIQNGEPADGNAGELTVTIEQLINELNGGEVRPTSDKSVAGEGQKFYIPTNRQFKNVKGTYYQAVVHFTADCDLVDVRAMSLIGNLQKLVSEIQYEPEELLDNAAGIDLIKEKGLVIEFITDRPLEEVETWFQNTPFLEKLELKNASVSVAPPSVNSESAVASEAAEAKPQPDKSGSKKREPDSAGNVKQNMISVNLNKLDLLMDLVGELVIAEAMVTRHPELEGLQLDNFHKAALQLQKLTKELQDVVMSVRMVPLAGTFQKMNRIVRDMNRNLGREVRLEIIGAETEVDKNIIEHVSDPLMHLIRNAVDHGIEPLMERLAKGKSGAGTIKLEAKNAGGDVLISVTDDGRGLNREKILEKAIRQGLTKKTEQELTDKEIYSFILLPGFSTKDQVTEYSGRGVGMDVVCKGIEKLGGKVLIDSTWGEGTTITLKIPLTLAIIDGMTIKVGNSLYTVPTTSIRESFRMRPEELITDPDGNEMIMIRGKCYPIIRLYKRFGIPTAITELSEGITMMVENNENAFCIFADELLGEQQVVVKALPKYLRKVKGIAGCTLLGNGEISLILDVAGLE